MTKTLLMVAHCPSENTRKLWQAVSDGVASVDLEHTQFKALAPLDTQPEDVLKADAIILGTTENLGYMSGALKDFFDRVYYPCLEKTDALPFALYIRAGHDGTGTRHRRPTSSAPPPSPRSPSPAGSRSASTSTADRQRHRPHPPGPPAVRRRRRGRAPRRSGTCPATTPTPRRSGRAARRPAGSPPRT